MYRYQNGSLLIATIQPRFTILHNLTTSRGPSPIVNLAWHASTAKQKSDMLAVQTNDGDLRVWSVSKQYTQDDPAKVVRILKRSENYTTGPNWMGWSKNGRIIQYSEKLVSDLVGIFGLYTDLVIVRPYHGMSGQSMSHTTQYRRRMRFEVWQCLDPAPAYLPSAPTAPSNNMT